MRGGRRRKSGKASRPVQGHRYLRVQLPAEGAAKGTPLVFYPRYSTVVGDRFEENLIDVAAFARETVASPSCGSLSIQLVEPDDSDRGWDGRPLKSDHDAKPGRRRPTDARREARGSRPEKGRRTGRRCR